jgi:hypothetical protein
MAGQGLKQRPGSLVRSGNCDEGMSMAVEDQLCPVRIGLDPGLLSEPSHPQAKGIPTPSISSAIHEAEHRGSILPQTKSQESFQDRIKRDDFRP